MSVYRPLLPGWGFTSGWNGVRCLHECMVLAMKNDAVLRVQSEISGLLGLPREALACFLRREDEVLVPRPLGNAFVPGYPGLLKADRDGDVAHEFWVEHPSTGELLMQGQGFEW